MKVLAYSPSVEVYAAIRKEGGYRYIDLSGDVVQCTVTRKCDAASTFSVRLQNVQHKYNGLFEPMDRVTILATKTAPVRLMTGYITSAPKFTTYGSDITIEGSCPLYRLQQLYWDPNLRESLLLMGYEGTEQSWDGVLRNLLVKVGGYSESQVLIGDMPTEAEDFAMKMYAAGRESSEGLKNMADEFMELLRAHGPKGASSGGGTVGDGGNLSGDEAKASDDQKKIVGTATGGGVPGQGGMCLKWVNDVYDAAGFSFQRYPLAVDLWRNRTSHTAYGTDMSKVPPGACVITSGSGSGGAGHIGIYIGNGNVISEVGGQRVETVTAFASWAHDTIDGISGLYGWVAPNCGAKWN